MQDDNRQKNEPGRDNPRGCVEQIFSCEIRVFRRKNRYHITILL